MRAGKAAVFVMCMVVASVAAAERPWVCLPGLKTPVRVVRGEVSCASSNGRDCLWEQCPGSNPVPQPWRASGPLQPLACGADHAAKHGGDGYSDPKHWCAQVCATSADCSASWHCLPGLKTPVRFAAGDIECASKNGRDCLWGSCPGSNPAPTPWRSPTAPARPLRCGADHAGKHGFDGYSKPDHWCAQACNWTPECAMGHQGWQCLPGVKTPVRWNNGDIECASKNGRDCLWGSCPGDHAVRPWAAPPGLQPLACGADHAAKQGGDGYSQPDHWCRLACDDWDCGK